MFNATNIVVLDFDVLILVRNLMMRLFNLQRQLSHQVR